MVNEATKILPVDYLDIKRVQDWLEEMALQGFYLDDTIGTWWHFNGGESKTVRYRIDPIVKKRGKIEPEKKEDFEAMGWHYVVTFREYHIFMADDADVEELHTDFRVESIALKKLEKRLWEELLQMFAIAIVPYLVSSYQRGELLSAIRYPVEFLTGENAAIIFVYFFLLIYLVKIGISLKKMRALRRVLFEGRDYEYSKNDFKNRKNHKVWNTVFWIIICLLLSMLFFSCQPLQEIDSLNTPRDILCLENLESGKVITESEGHSDFLGGWIEDRWNPFLEKNYQIFQRGLVEGQLESSPREYVKLNAEYYKIRISGMAEMLYKELVDKNINTSQYTYDITSVSGTRLDVCVVGNSVDKQILVGLKGEEVIYAEYSGAESMVENAAKIVNLMLDAPMVGSK